MQHPTYQLLATNPAPTSAVDPTAQSTTYTILGPVNRGSIYIMGSEEANWDLGNTPGIIARIVYHTRIVYAMACAVYSAYYAIWPYLLFKAKANGFILA